MNEKAQATRERNKALRDAAKAEREVQEKQDRALVLEALRAVLTDPEATSAQRLYAVAVLDNMKHYCLVPYGVKYPSTDEGVAAFAVELEAGKAGGESHNFDP